MRICCNQSACIYNRLGECHLDHAAPAGDFPPPENACVYFVGSASAGAGGQRPGSVRTGEYNP